MIRDNRYVKAFYFLNKLPEMYKEVNDCASSDISELLGSALVIYKKVFFLLIKTIIYTVRKMKFFLNFSSLSNIP